MQNDQSQKAALNLYGILDNELARMHALLQTHMTSSNQGYSSNYGGLSSSGLSGAYGTSAIYQRILHMQELLLAAVAGHDKAVQDKVAELALMGESDETKMQERP